jgi:hypothetical protein
MLLGTDAISCTGKLDAVVLGESQIAVGSLERVIADSDESGQSFRSKADSDSD